MKSSCFAGSTLLSILITATSFAQSDTIRIRFVNGKSGKPLRLKSYERGSSTAATGQYKIEKIDGDTLTVSFKDTSEFAFRSRYFEPCDTKDKGEVQPKYNVREVIEHGVVAPNYCGHAHDQPRPGELVIYSRHEHWWRVTGDIARGLLICA